MSGLEIFGAVGAAAALVELASKCTKHLIHIKEARGDATARDLLKRVELLTETIKDVFLVLSQIHAQPVKHHITEAEITIWDRMKSVLLLCRRHLEDLRTHLSIVSAKTEGVIDRTKEAWKLSVILPNVKRIKDDIDTYVDALVMLKSLLNVLSTHRQEAVQRSMRRDIREIKVQHGDKLEDALKGIAQIKDALQNRLPQRSRSGSVLDGDHILTVDDKVDSLSVHLEQILIAAQDVKTSFEDPEIASKSSSPTKDSQATLPNSSTTSIMAETQSLPSIQIAPDSLPDITHIEPLRELAQRFKEQAESDFSHGYYQSAEIHQLESIRCYEELHDAHNIPFDSHHEMKMTLAEILQNQKKFFEAQEIALQAQRGRLDYDQELGCRSTSLEVDEDGACARASYLLAHIVLNMYESGTPNVSLDNAAKYGKRSFQLRRERFGKESDELKETAQLLVQIYSRDPRKSMYAETYRDLYLSDGDFRHDSFRPDSVSLSLMTTSTSGTLSINDGCSIIEAVKNHKEGDLKEVIFMIGEATHTATDLNKVKAGKSAMMIAMDCGCERCDTIIHKLLRSGAARDAPFQYAVEKQKFENCSILLKHDANIDKLDLNHFTPLMNAIKRHDKDMVSFLIANKASLNIPGDGGRTALHHAIQTRNSDILKLLLDNLADLELDAQDHNGLTVLHYCAKYDKSRFAKRLVRAGADIEKQDDSDWHRTPLWIAAKEGKYNFAKTLLQLGAKVDLAYLPTASGDMRNLLREYSSG